ncbi:phage regulatory CII family protein [Methylorubrum populi]
MTGRQLPSRDYLGLKAAFRDLVEAAGGGTRAATRTRGSASLFSRYGAVQEEMQAPLDVVADLEAETGDLIVTRALAALHGYVLVPNPEGVPSAANFGRHLGVLAREAGDVISGLGEALADDGVVSDREARALLGEVREAQEALAHLGSDLTRVADGDGRAIRRKVAP